APPPADDMHISGRSDPLHAVVIGIGDEQVPGRVGSQTARRGELSGRGAGTADDLVDLPATRRGPRLRRRLVWSLGHGPSGSDARRTRVIQLQKVEPVAHT